jgi:hypothetical protein
MADHPVVHHGYRDDGRADPDLGCADRNDGSAVADDRCTWAMTPNDRWSAHHG